MTRDSCRAACVALVLLAFVLTAPEIRAQSDPTTPRIEVTIGLGGFTSWAPACGPIVAEITGGTSAFNGILHVRQRDAGNAQSYEIPLSAEPGSRRRLEVISCGLRGWSWEWSLDGKTWSSEGVNVTQAPGIPVLAVIGEDIGRLRTLEGALGGSMGNPGQGTSLSDPSRTAVIAPDDAPRDADAWRQAPVVVLDSRAAPLLLPESVTALRDHVRSGATVIVAGPELGSVPPRLLAATASGPTEETFMVDGAPRVVRGEALLPAEGAQAIRDWMVLRRLGSGRLVTLGLDLRDPEIREALDEKAWLAMAGLTANSMAPSIDEPPWIFGVQALLQQEQPSRIATSWLPPMSGGIYLLAAAVALGAGTWMLGRRPGGSRRRDVALLYLALAAPAFLAGFLQRRASPHEMIVIDYWPEEGRARVITWTPLTHAGATPLPEGASLPISAGALQREFPSFRQRLGPNAFIDIDNLPRFVQLSVRTTRWREQSLAAFHVRQFEDEGTSILQGSAQSSPQVVGGSNLDDRIAQVISGSGVSNAQVLVEEGSSPSRVVWIVRGGLP